MVQLATLVMDIVVVVKLKKSFVFVSLMLLAVPQKLTS